MATIDADGVLNVFEMRTGSALLSTKLSCSANQIQFSPFGDVIVVASSDNKVKLVDATSGKLLSEVRALHISRPLLHPLTHAARRAYRCCRGRRL